MIQELNDDTSMIYKLIADRRGRECMLRVRTPEGHSLAGLLFVTSDHNGRKIFLTLTEDGSLTGTDWEGKKIILDGSISSLCAMLEHREILTSFFALAILLAFERGLTWMGGMFQAVYLREWQKCFVQVLNELDMNDEAERIKLYDCSG